MDLNNFLHVACNYYYLGWVLTWKYMYLKQGFWGKSYFLVEKSHIDNNNYKPHAKNYSNPSMFTQVIA
jgi:hypothetical protein